MKLFKLAIIFMCMFAVLFSASSSFAKKKSKKSKEIAVYDDRELKGHKYIRPYNFPLAMPTTNVGVSLGYAYANWNWDSKEDFIFFKEDSFPQAGINEVLDFEISFLERFSLEAVLEGMVLGGADENSALLYGGQGNYFASFIPKIMAYQNDRWGMCLSFSAGLNWSQGAGSSPLVLMTKMIENMEREVLQLIDDLVDGDIQTENELEDALDDAYSGVTKISLDDALITQNLLTIRPALLYAQTIHPVFGFQVGLRYDYGFQESLDGPDMFDLDAGDPPRTIMVGGVGTFDLNPISKAHVGFKVEGDYHLIEDDGESYVTRILGGGVVYTGRKNLELGMTYHNQYDEDDEMDFTAHILRLNMRYFF